MDTKTVGLSHVVKLMQRKGLKNVLLKPLANNDNSKNQIYLGTDFKVIQALPSGDVYSDGVTKKGPTFKAPINLHWLSLDGSIEKAPGAQLILYPNYPEVRLSGVLKSCKTAPSHLFQPPTRSEREARRSTPRYLIFGIFEDCIIAYTGAWEDQLSLDATNLIERKQAKPAASVFYEYPLGGTDSRQKLLARLGSIYRGGPVRSCRLNKDGDWMEYRAKNGAGYTLESLFGITPNGHSEPDFMDWELKVHSSGSVTLLTPEPDMGSYLTDLQVFLRRYGTKIEADRLDFASRHNVGTLNAKSRLMLRLEGYNPKTGKIDNPEGGLILRDGDNHCAAGWSFSKLIGHWKRKHSNTCFISYSREERSDAYYFSYGPEVTLGTGTDIGKFLRALYSSTIFYDPGINMKLRGEKWVPKKRNQFRVAWRHRGELYADLEVLDLNDL